MAVRKYYIVESLLQAIVAFFFFQNVLYASLKNDWS